MVVKRRRLAVGAWGEAQACAFLERLGWQVLEHNWRCRVGEVDLVAREPDGTIVLVEVRTRSGLGYGTPLESITRAKQAKLRELVHWWRREHPVAAPVRVDAIGVLRTRTGVEITHLRGAL
ncbi:YraN family protein [Propionibacteriaceae bacterium Y1923]|uniref:YraN family protein n=1 Tax=Aestuariimicrobium sp. Y1814 TaxID=3418742 RepID=UPI003C1A1228